MAEAPDACAAPQRRTRSHHDRVELRGQPATPHTQARSSARQVQPTLARQLAREKEETMLHWAAAFFVIAIIAAVFGFGGFAASVAGVAKVLFVVFLVMAGISLLFGRRRVVA
jgi:uncharacterized membrane protein YtjA (UPF0391 family)